MSLAKIKAKKPKIKQKIGRSELFMINRKYLGEEPDANMIENKLAESFNWFNSMLDKNDAKEYMQEYLKETNQIKLLKKFNSVNDNMLPLTACWMARMIKIHPSHYKNINFSEKIANYINVLEEQKSDFSDRTITVTPKSKYNDFISDIEVIVDQNKECNVFEYLKEKNITVLNVQKIISYYQPWLDELVAVQSKTDQQLNEGYTQYTNSFITQRILFFKKLIKDCNQYINIGKVTKQRKPRKKKDIPNSKKLQNFKYQKESQEYRIASINPEKILGAQSVWLFNTKYKIMTLLNAQKDKSLEIKGTSVINYDEQTSISKTTGRKTQEAIDKVKNSGKIALKKVMDDIKTKTVLKDRCNEDIIILRVL